MKHFTPAADCDFDWWKDFTKRVLIAATMMICSDSAVIIY